MQVQVITFKLAYVPLEISLCAVHQTYTPDDVVLGPVSHGRHGGTCDECARTSTVRVGDVRRVGGVDMVAMRRVGDEWVMGIQSGEHVVASETRSRATVASSPRIGRLSGLRVTTGPLGGLVGTLRD